MTPFEKQVAIGSGVSLGITVLSYVLSGTFYNWTESSAEAIMAGEGAWFEPETCEMLSSYFAQVYDNTFWISVSAVTFFVGLVIANRVGNKA